MHIWTHKLLAELLYEGIYAVHQGVISRNEFIHGNLIPDLDNRYQQFHHYTHGCWTYLESLMDEIDNIPFRSEGRSEKMGIICHFIADFFCKVHNRPYSEQHSLLGHVMYEHQLHKLYRGMQKDKTRLMAFARNASVESCCTSRHWMNTRMASIHREYIDGIPDMEKDICYAIGTCVEFSNFLIARERSLALNAEAIA